MRSAEFVPKDASLHNPFAIEAFLNKKLRWVTLGGQYDWTQKVYPSTPPPSFPPDVAGLVEGLIPAMKAEAAIVNLYSPGDTLSLHRDVSEECNKPLVSISLGCDAIFLVGHDATETNRDLEGFKKDGTEPRAAAMRLRSGDLVVMAGEARTAWHSVPQVVAGTCPDWMADWPCLTVADQDAEGAVTKYEAWKGWMAGKRINLNVRQMRDDAP